MAAATRLAAQQGGKKLRIAVADFDYQKVRQSAEELFGGAADVGPRASLAEASRSDLRAASQFAKSGVDAVLTGNVLAYGKREGQGPGVSVKIGGIGLGRLGKTQSVAYVMFSVQFVGSGGVLALAPVMAHGEASGPGTSLLGDLNVAGLKAGGQINLSGAEYSKTTLGKATTKALESLCKQVDAMYDQVAGANAPAAPVVAAAMPAGVPFTPLPAAYAAPITGPFTWGLYQFKGTEHFKYDAHMVEGGEKEDGWYTLDAKPPGKRDVSAHGRRAAGHELVSFDQHGLAGPGNPLHAAGRYGSRGGDSLQSDVHNVRWPAVAGKRVVLQPAGRECLVQGGVHLHLCGRERAPWCVAQEQPDHAGHVRLAQRRATAGGDGDGRGG
jgi:hypothetical protein